MTVGALRAGRGRLHPIEEGELRPGRRAARAAPAMPFRPRHPHPGAARRGGGRARLLARGGPGSARPWPTELGLDGRARFVEADLYDAPAAIHEPAAFDLVYVTWGAINWLPDIRRWAEIVAFFLRPGGTLYLAEGHPAALVLDDLAPTARPDARLVRALLRARRAAVYDAPSDYADPNARLANARTCEWMHPLGEVVTERTSRPA